jgi:hypothetical protein
LEEEEARLLREEYELNEELKQYQDKHQHVKLVYEKVIENIKSLCHIPTGGKYENSNLNDITLNNNTNESKVFENNLSINTSANYLQPIPEEDLLKTYNEFLNNTKNNIDNLFLSHSKEEFLNIMLEKGYDINNPNSVTRGKNKNATLKKSLANNNNMDIPTSHRNIKQQNEEYDYFDEDNKEDEENKKERDEIIRTFKANERSKLLESIKADKEKK